MLSIFYQDVSQLKSVDFLLINKKSCPLRESMNRHARVNTKNYANEFHAASGVWRNAHSYTRINENTTNAGAWPEINMQVYTLRAPVGFNILPRQCTGCSRATALCLILLFCAVKGSKTASTSAGVREIIMDVCPQRSQHRNNMHLGTRGAHVQNKCILTAASARRIFCQVSMYLHVFSSCVWNCIIKLLHKYFSGCIEQQPFYCKWNNRRLKSRVSHLERHCLSVFLFFYFWYYNNQASQMDSFFALYYEKLVSLLL